MKIKITYEEEAQLQSVLNVLRPLLTGAKIHKNDTYKPYLHAYIELKNTAICSEIKQNS